MPSTFMNNADAVLLEGLISNFSILIEGDSIVAVSVNAGRSKADKIIDAAKLTISAGFIDIHIHGAVGIDVNTADADGLLKISEFLAKNGVTAWVPTLVPDSDENYRRIIAEIDRFMAMQEDKPVAQVVGVHYEGVFANEKMCGALRPEFFKTYKSSIDSRPDAEASPLLCKEGSSLSELPRLKKGVHLTTLAPEIEGGVDLIKELVKQDWIPLIGHTKADAKTLEKAFVAGAKHFTHFYNAMTGLHHRDLGVAGWALTNDNATIDIIADGIHVHPKMLELACRVKTGDKVSLISDSVAPTGLGDGIFELWGETITVENGRTRNERGSIAGSVITMLDAVKMMKSLGFSEAEVSKMASLNPARLLGIDNKRGSIEAGKRADLVAIDEQGNLAWTMIGGQMIEK